MAGAGLGWNTGLPPSEPNGPWCDILEYEIAWALAGQPQGARTITDGSIAYNFGAISTAVIKWKENSERGRKSASDITKTMLNQEGVITAAIKAGTDDGGGGTPCSKEMIAAYINHVMSEPLRNALPIGAPTEVFFSQGSGAHTDVCLIKGEVGAITDWSSYHAKHNVAPESRCIGLSQAGNSVFYNSQWSEDQQDKAQAIEDAYESWGENYSDDQRDLTASLFIEKCATDTAFKASMVEYIYHRMVGLKAVVIKSSCSALTEENQSQIEYTDAQGATQSLGVSNWSVGKFGNENWVMRAKEIRVVAHSTSKVQAFIEIKTPVLVSQEGNVQNFQDKFIPAFALAFRQDPIRLNKLEELEPPLRDQRIAEVETSLTQLTGGQKVEWSDVMEWYRHEDIPAQVPKRKNNPDGPKKDNPLKVSEDILAKTTPLTSSEITKLKKGHYIAPEGFEGGWTIMEKEKKRKGVMGLNKYYVALGDYPDDEELDHLNTVPGDKVNRAAQVSTSAENLDQEIVDNYIPRGTIMTERQRKIVTKALRLIFENENVPEDAKEDLMSMSFDEFISFGDESIDEEAEALQERWLKLAGILRG